MKTKKELSIEISRTADLTSGSAYFKEEKYALFGIPYTRYETMQLKQLYDTDTKAREII